MEATKLRAESRCRLSRGKLNPQQLVSRICDQREDIGLRIADQHSVVFSDLSAEADAHGAALTKHDRYLWVADRGRNFLWVIDTATDEVVRTIGLAGSISNDPTPDLLALSPNGSHVFMSLRGPNPLTADPHVSTGSTPGVGVVRAIEAGQSGIFEHIARVSNLDSAGIERADIHALTIRLKE